MRYYRIVKTANVSSVLVMMQKIDPIFFFLFWVINVVVVLVCVTQSGKSHIEDAILSTSEVKRFSHCIYENEYTVYIAQNKYFMA